MSGGLKYEMLFETVSIPSIRREAPSKGIAQRGQFNLQRIVRVSSGLPKMPDFFLRSDSATHKSAATSIFSEKGVFLLLSSTVNGKSKFGVDTATSTENILQNSLIKYTQKTEGLEKEGHSFFYFLVVKFFIGFSAANIIPEVL